MRRVFYFTKLQTNLDIYLKHHMNQINYINLIDLFRHFADNHQQVKRYGVGTVQQLERVIADSPLFPMLWVNLDNVSYPTDNQKTYNFNVMVFDILNSDQSNELDIQNDAILVLEDLIKFLNHNNQDGYFQISFGGQLRIEPFTDNKKNTTEFTSGAGLTLNFDVDSNLQNNCGTPIAPYDFTASSVRYL